MSYIYTDKWVEPDRNRYVDFWDSRSRGLEKRWTWYERVEVKPTTGFITLYETLKTWNTNPMGIPFQSDELPFMNRHDAGQQIDRYDNYYHDRMEWKMWSVESAGCLAKRAWNKGVKQP